MATHLPRSTPAEQYVDPLAVLAFVDAVDADPDVELHSVMVVRHGHVVAEGWWAPHTSGRARLLYSLSKSFTSTAFGFALHEGLVGLDDTVLSHFPELADAVSDPRARAMTLRHLASMASGHTRDTHDEALSADPREPVRGFLTIPPDQEPGSVFAYNQPCTYTLAAVIQRAAGITLSEYLRPRLFDPLGIDEVGWQAWPPGREIGFSGLFARTEDVAKLGLLYLQGGRWEDIQLLPRSYVELATTKHIDNPAEPSPDWQQGYGFQFWMARHGYRGDGAFGQFCVVLPEQDAVVVTTGGTEAMQAVLDHLWLHLLPGFLDERPDDSAQPDLEKRLGELALHPSLPAVGWEDWPDATFRVVDPPSELASVELRRADGRLEVTLTEPDNRITFPLGQGEWLTSEPEDTHGDPVAVAASAACSDDDTLLVEVVFLETPHRVDITCSLGERTASVTWRPPPLGDRRLRSMHRPR